MNLDPVEMTLKLTTDMDLLAKILKEEAEKNRHLAFTKDGHKYIYCTIDLHGDVPILVLREPIEYEDDQTTDLGPLEDFIKKYSI